MRYYTFIMLKPDALERDLVEKIIARFKNENYSIEIVGHKIVSEDLIFEHYKDVIKRYGEDFKVKARNAFVGRHVLTVILSSDDANIIGNVRRLIGATDPQEAQKATIRGDFGIDSMENAMKEGRSCENLIHASDSVESFKTEINLWFSDDILTNIIV